MNKRSEDTSKADEIARDIASIRLKDSELHFVAIEICVRNALKQERSKAIRDCIKVCFDHDGNHHGIPCYRCEDRYKVIEKLLPEDEKAPTDGGKDATIKGKEGK